MNVVVTDEKIRCRLLLCDCQRFYKARFDVDEQRVNSLFQRARELNLSVEQRWALSTVVQMSFQSSPRSMRAGEIFSLLHCYKWYSYLITTLQFILRTIWLNTVFRLGLIRTAAVQCYFQCEIKCIIGRFCQLLCVPKRKITFQLPHRVGISCWP